MDAVGHAAGTAVGVVLLVAGVLKLREPSWTASARAFGAPAPVAPLVPWVEILLGAMLVAGAGGRGTAAVATAVLVGFTLAVARHLVRGDRVPCACFGARSAAPVDGRTLVRNLALVALAVVAAVAGPSGGGLAAAALGAGAGAVFAGTEARGARG